MANAASPTLKAMVSLPSVVALQSSNQQQTSFNAGIFLREQCFCSWDYNPEGGSVLESLQFFNPSGVSCSWLSILLMMAYMGTVTVILLNILIAQMSTTYTQVKKFARLEYDVDRILQLTRMERFPFLV